MALDEGRQGVVEAVVSAGRCYMLPRGARRGRHERYVPHGSGGARARRRLLRIEGTALHVEGLDAIDGSPVLDVKPYMRELGPCGEVLQPEWSTELMRGYY